MDSTGPFTRDPAKLDAIARAFLKMKQVKDQPKDEPKKEDDGLITPKK